MIRIYSAIISKVTYDMNVTNMQNTYIQNAQSSMYALSIAQIPGRFWIDFLPFLKYVPPWFPGAHFKKFAERYKPIINRMVDEPFDEVKNDMVSGSSLVDQGRGLTI